MPKFVGQKISGAIQVQNNASTRNMTNHVRLSYAQAMILVRHAGPANLVYSLDTTDKGGRGSYAKRWYRWFAWYRDVLECRQSTPLLVAAARKVDYRIRAAISVHS